MPGPFPGMDPYLESPAYWRDVHHRLISIIAEDLNRLLPESYVARIDERIYLAEPARPVFPDVSVRVREPSRPQSSPHSGQSSVATLSLPEAPWQVMASNFQDFPEQIPEAFIEILAVRPQRRLVTAIEVLSPSNKALGSAGRASYRQKQQEPSQQLVSLLEIDLLRSGEHTIGAPLELLREFGTWDYLACLHRAGAGQVWEVWPSWLRAPLPTVLVPLAIGEGDVPISLQEALDRAYDRGAYARDLDYGREPEPPLNEEDAAWTRELLCPLAEGPNGAEANGCAP